MPRHSTQMCHRLYNWFYFNYVPVFKDMMRLCFFDVVELSDDRVNLEVRKGSLNVHFLI